MEATECGIDSPQELLDIMFGDWLDEFEQKKHKEDPLFDTNFFIPDELAEEWYTLPHMLPDILNQFDVNSEYLQISIKPDTNATPKISKPTKVRQRNQQKKRVMAPQE
jgi:hypothetical protein